MTQKDIRKKIIEKEIDINNTDLFFSDVLKAAIVFLNDNIKLRNKRIPHFILNTGDEIMYRELMGYEYSSTEVTDENFVYNEIPRCIITCTDINTLPDQLTQPYVRSCFDLEYDGCLYEFSAETRRMPIQSSISLKYYLDSMTDCFTLSQYLITTLSYIRTFSFIYMGNEVICSLKFPDSFSSEVPSSLSFDTDSRYKTISIELTLESNLPIFNEKTAIETSTLIRQIDNKITSKMGAAKSLTYTRDKHEDLFNFNMYQIEEGYKVCILHDKIYNNDTPVTRWYELVNKRILFSDDVTEEERETAWKVITNEN